MWKRPAQPGAPTRARPPLAALDPLTAAAAGRRRGIAALLLLPALAAAGDLGVDVAFPNASPAAFRVLQVPPGTIVFDSGQSALVAEAWDTLLFQGASPDPEVFFEVSRREPSGSWSSWTPAQTHRHPGGRFWAKAVLPPAAPGPVRIRAVAGAVSTVHTVSLFTVEVFASEPSQARTGPEPRAALAPKLPGLRERESWGARRAKQPYEPDAPYRLTLHHTSGHRPASLAESVREVFFIQDFHQNGRGWNDIAYHYLVDPEGRVFEGRPLGALGAHAYRHNAGNVGVAFLGTHHPPKNDAATTAQLGALIALGRWLRSEHSVDPQTLKGHRDLKSTDCPGDELYPMLPGLRAAMSKPPEPARLPAWLLAFPRWDGLRASPR